MICTHNLEQCVLKKTDSFEQKYLEVSQNFDDISLKLLAKKIKKDSVKMNHLFANCSCKSIHFEKIEVFYQLFVTILLPRIRKKLCKITPLLNVPVAK